MKGRISNAVVWIGIAVALPAAAGPWDQPYVLFEGEKASQTRDTQPARIIAIDGVQVRTGRTEPVAPGMRKVEVSLPGKKGMSNPIRETMEIDAKACTRYRLAAKRSSRTDDDWKAFIAQEESIGECKKKFAAKS